MTPDCGSTPFISPSAVPPVSSVIHTRGCMAAIKAAMDAEGLPMLLAAALAALVAALLQLLLLLTVCCFADHVTKMKDVYREFDPSIFSVHKYKYCRM